MNLRTLLVIVLVITSLSVIYQDITTQSCLIILALVLIAFFSHSRHNLEKIWHRLRRIGKLILTLMIFQVLFRNEGALLFQFGFIKVSSGGLEYGLVSSMRFTLIILIAGLLFDVPYSKYLLAFRAWKFPYELSFLIATVIHFIPLFTSEFKRSLEALALRGIELSKIPLLQRAKTYNSLMFPVIARAISDVKYRTISLELRGFRLYPNRTSLYEDKLSVKDVVIQIIMILFFIVVITLRGL